MRRFAFMLLGLAAALTATAAPSPAATQEWVKQYVATNNVSIVTNAAGDNVYSTMAGTNPVSVVVHVPKVPALITRDCANGTPYTNGMTFAYVPRYAVYANVPAGLTIAAGINYNAASNAVMGFCSYPDFTYVSSNINNQTWLHLGATPVVRLVSTQVIETEAFALTNGFVFAEVMP